MEEHVVGSWVGDRVDLAIDKLARAPTPQVIIGEPEYDENGMLVNRQVDVLTLIQTLDGLTREEVPRVGPIGGCVEELMCILAARQGLVLVRRIVPIDGLTPGTLACKLPSEDLALMVLQGNDWFKRNSFGSKQEVCLSLISEDELTPEDLVIYRVFPDEDGLEGYLSFDRLVPRDKLTPEQVMHAGDFVTKIDLLGEEEYFIKETDRVKMAVDLIEGIEQL